mmetsp:Transcript_16027/g.24397  ORF Transcript_16027/g.24397 Transcript_16027/m.24397 type:complete len:115 (-) Transcript_16027:76-420(-)
MYIRNNFWNDTAIQESASAHTLDEIICNTAKRKQTTHNMLEYTTNSSNRDQSMKNSRECDGSIRSRAAGTISSNTIKHRTSNDSRFGASFWWLLLLGSTAQCQMSEGYRVSRSY